MKRLALLPAVIALALTLSARGATAETGGTAWPEWDGSRSTPVHRLPLYDELSQQVIPAYPQSLPFSVRTTCGPCHPYEAVSQGLHFNSTAAGNPGRPGEPWVWVDPTTGTQIPLSYRDWPGVYHPDAIGMTDWQFVQTFGRHLPGGDMAEAPEETPDSRWPVSGELEINCLGCHNTHPHQDMSEWAKQMERENFRWAATAAAGLGEVGGMASRVRDAWTLFEGPDRDDTEWAVPPHVNYDLKQFDNRHRHVFEVVHKPKDDRCLYCHSVRDIGVDRWQSQADVHSNAGLDCADCHRNGLDHKMIRGYPGEAAERGEPAAADFTCEGCHSAGAEGAQPGRLGAPVPQHKGLPPVHFERMTCTACHSGPAAAPGELRTVRTSRINRMGIHGRARWFTDLPRIAEPVLARDLTGRIAPHRALWPAFWGTRDSGGVTPLQPAAVAEHLGGILGAETRAAALLAALDQTPDASGEAVLVAGGRVFRRDISGDLDSAPYSGALTGTHWARDVNGRIELQVPAELTIDEEGYVDADQEARILASFEALDHAELGMGEPVYVLDGAVYLLDEELGYFDVSEIEAGDGFANGLAWYDGETVAPLLDDLSINAIVAIDGKVETLTPEQVAAGLRHLADSGLADSGLAGGREVVYVAAGRLFHLANGSLTATDDPAADPVLWPMAHDVRPAAQSLGAGGCEDCHSADSAYLFGALTATGPMLTGEPAMVSYAALMDLDEGFQRLFGSSFRLRGAFKVAAAGGSGIIAGFALLYLLMGLSRLTGALHLRAAVFAAAVCVIALAITGFGAWWVTAGPLGGSALLLHLSAGGALILVLPFLALSRHGAVRWMNGNTPRGAGADASPLSRFGLWLLLTAGLLTALTIVFSMVPVFGTHGLETLLSIHRWSGVAACLGLAVFLLRRR